MAMSQDDVTTAACVHGEQEECEEVEKSAGPGKWSQVCFEDLHHTCAFGIMIFCREYCCAPIRWHHDLLP